MHGLPLVFSSWQKWQQIQEEQQWCACQGNGKTKRLVLRETKFGLSQRPRLLSKKFPSFTTSLGMASLSILISWRSLSLHPKDSILEVRTDTLHNIWRSNTVILASRIFWFCLLFLFLRCDQQTKFSSGTRHGRLVLLVLKTVNLVIFP